MTDAQARLDGEMSPLETIEGALDWWREAGVDCDFADEPSGWLTAPADEAAPQGALPTQRVAAPAPQTPLQRAIAGDEPAHIGGDRSAWPADLDGFRQWWMTEPTLAEGMLDRRRPPRGAAGSRLLVLVGEPEINAPESDDDDALLSGQAGRLLSAMLRAMGIAEHEAYCASALPAPAALPDWSDLAMRGLAEVTRHHIALASPTRVLLFGRELAPLCGLDPAQAREPAALDCGGAALPLLVAPSLDQIARSPGRRERFWQCWLDWTR